MRLWTCSAERTSFGPFRACSHDERGNFGSRCTHIFLSRFLLDLRELYFTDSQDTDGGAPTTASRGGIFPSSIRFTSSNIVGNLGATNRTTFNCPYTNGVGPEWYEDETPQYVSNPFEVGMLLPVSTDAPTTTEVQSEEAV